MIRKTHSDLCLLTLYLVVLVAQAITTPSRHTVTPVSKAPISLGTEEVQVPKDPKSTNFWMPYSACAVYLVPKGNEIWVNQIGGCCQLPAEEAKELGYPSDKTLWKATNVALLTDSPLR